MAYVILSGLIFCTTPKNTPVKPAFPAIEMQIIWLIAGFLARKILPTSLQGYDIV